MMEPLLSRADEIALLEQAKKGSQRAIARLVTAFQPLVRARANAASREYKLEADDLAQEASIEILDAIRRFDLARGHRFSTFLQGRLRGVFTAAHREDQHTRITISWWQSDADFFRHDRRELRTKVRLTRPVSDYWPLPAIQYVRHLRRHNDRVIAKGLWLDTPPRRPADLARYLGISRSAVTQRRQKLQSALRRKFGMLLFEQEVMRKSLNTFPDDAISL